jgi:hypothetical protein
MENFLSLAKQGLHVIAEKKLARNNSFERRNAQGITKIIINS